MRDWTGERLRWETRLLEEITKDLQGRVWGTGNSGLNACRYLLSLKVTLLTS